MIGVLYNMLIQSSLATSTGGCCTRGRVVLAFSNQDGTSHSTLVTYHTRRTPRILYLNIYYHLSCKLRGIFSAMWQMWLAAMCEGHSSCSAMSQETSTVAGCVWSCKCPVCRCVCMHICIYVCMYVCIYECMCVFCVCICMYV